jgi:hypothetical protein
MIEESGGPKPHQIKRRVYEFYMPDQNVKFEVDYEVTVGFRDRIAYVAQAAKRGGGYKSGIDQDTATSWGTASNDLQAVINSYTPGLYAEIWLLKGTYTVPNPADYTVPVPNETGPVFTASSPSGYHVPGMPISGISVRGDIAFVIRPELPPLRGGFEEDHYDESERFQAPYVDLGPGKEAAEYQAARKTVLSGAGAAYHVVIASGVTAAIDTLTITGGLGPALDASVTVNGNSVSRQAGGGMHIVNSEMALTNLLVRNNKTRRGAGMYVKSSGQRSELNRVYFFSNTALESGGGMYNEAGAGNFVLEINNSRFEENKSVDTGGGLYISGANCTPTIRGSDFISNSAQQGGGIYTAGGNTVFSRITVEKNWTSGNGAGIYNANASATVSKFDNITVQENESKGGNGIGIYNTGTLHMTNAKIKENVRTSGGPSGGGMYNAGTALFGNVTIENNSANTGAGITNAGSLSLANVIIRNNNVVNGSAVSGSAAGLYNVCLNAGAVKALLNNVTIAGNSGGGIYNEFEGVPDNGSAGGVLSVILNNVRISGNSASGAGPAIFNRYYRYSGKGIELTLNNTTIAGNYAPGGIRNTAIYNWKDTSLLGAAFVEDEAGESLTKRSFPVYVQIRNSVIHGNSNSSAAHPNIAWVSGSADVIPTADREVIINSFIEDKPHPVFNPAGNTDPGFVSPLSSPSRSDGGNYRLSAGSPLIDRGMPGHFPSNDNLLLTQLFWKTLEGATIEPYRPLLNIPVQLLVISGFPFMDYRGVSSYFLVRDNGFNVGDLRDPAGAAVENYRTSGQDIGAYKKYP